MCGQFVQLNEAVLKTELRELVRRTVEDTLNGLLDAEAEQLTGAARYERTEARQGYRSGTYDRGLTTSAGQLTLSIPRLKGLPFQTAIIERYRRRESSVEEAMVEMYLAGVSTRRVEDVTELLWGSRVSASTLSELNKKAYDRIEAWRNRPLSGGKYPYVYVDGLYLRRNWGGSYEKRVHLGGDSCEPGWLSRSAGRSGGNEGGQIELAQFFPVAQGARFGRSQAHGWRQMFGSARSGG